MTLFASNALGRYCVPRSSAHTPVAQRILAGEVHEPDTIELLVREAREHAFAGAILHAGAYFGDMLPGLAAGGATVFAYEPSAENWLHAVGTIHLNGLDRVRVARTALGSRAGQGSLRTHLNAGPALGGQAHLVDGGGDEQVPVRALDELVVAHPVAAIHLDVERAEERALIGAERILAEWRPVLVLETVPDELPTGYEQTGTVHQNAVLRYTGAP